jgi:YfiH family protein
MELILPDWPAPDNVRAFSTLRIGGFSLPPYGDSNGGKGLNLGMHVGDDREVVARNRALLRSKLPDEPAWLNQIHGAEVVDAAVVKGVPDADASWTAVPGKVCIIMTADCLPVLFCTDDGKAVAAAHAGWRGLAGGVLQNTVRVLKTVSDAEILAWMGPAIGPNAFEVGQDVKDVFAGIDRVMESAFVPEEGVPGKYMANIYQIARTVLSGLGVTAVYGGDRCTVSEPDAFYSFRRDNGVTGRMATGIWLSEK